MRGFPHPRGYKAILTMTLVPSALHTRAAAITNAPWILLISEKNIPTVA